MKALGAVILVIAYVCIALAFVSGIGVGLYSLGVLNMAFGASAWAGFVVWMKMIGGGFVGLIVGFVMTAIGK